jgi:hypothetical protein
MATTRCNIGGDRIRHLATPRHGSMLKSLINMAKYLGIGVIFGF